MLKLYKRVVNLWLYHKSLHCDSMLSYRPISSSHHATWKSINIVLPSQLCFPSSSHSQSTALLTSLLPDYCTDYGHLDPALLSTSLEQDSLTSPSCLPLSADSFLRFVARVSRSLTTRHAPITIKLRQRETSSTPSAFLLSSPVRLRTQSDGRPDKPSTHLQWSAAP